MIILKYQSFYNIVYLNFLYKLILYIMYYIFHVLINITSKLFYKNI